jgi:hypothetical protein
LLPIVNKDPRQTPTPLINHLSNTGIFLAHSHGYLSHPFDPSTNNPGQKSVFILSFKPNPGYDGTVQLFYGSRRTSVASNIPTGSLIPDDHLNYITDVTQRQKPALRF